MQQSGGQNQVVQAHIGQRQRGDDNGRAGGREAGDEGGHTYRRGPCIQPQGKAAVVDRQLVPQRDAGPGHRQDRQAQQHQVQWQPPGRGAQVAAVVIFSKHHVENMGHTDGPGKKHHQQGARRVVAQRVVQGAAHLGVLPQPLLERVKTAEYPVNRRQQQDKHGAQLYQGFKGYGRHQPGIALLGRQVARAEQDREHGYDDAKHQGQSVLPVFPGKQVVGISGHDLDAVGDCLDLQGEQWQQGDTHCQRDGRANPGAAKAKGQDIGQGGQLVNPAQAQQGQQQQRGKHEHEHHAAVVEHETVAVAVGDFHDAVTGHGPGEDAQGQDVGGGMVGDSLGDDAPVGQVGDGKQAGQVGDDKQQYLGEAKAHPEISSAGSRTPRR